MEKLLKPAASSAVLLIVTIWAMMGDGMQFAQLAIAGLLFVGSGIWLAAQGELRAELKAVGAREQRRGRMERIEEIHRSLEEGPVSTSDPTLRLQQPSDETTTPTANLTLSTDQATPAITPTLTHSSRTYHFDSEESATHAAQGSASIETLSQAVSVGNVKAVAPELYMQADKPVVVLAFIAGIILFGIFIIWSSGTASAGILVVSGAISLVFIGISRWRASTNSLTLPDILGIETPFAATMIGLTLMHFVGRLAPGASLGNQLDFAVLAIILLLIVGISLTGRKDLVHRIPAAIEWYISILVISRCANTVMAGTMPIPILTDPLTPISGGDTLSFTIPFIIVEIILLGCVIGWDWIEGAEEFNGINQQQ